MADDYVCTLTEASLKTAKEELNEDPKERLSSVTTFRNWIVSQPHIKCSGDTKYLLRFLRAAKFSQLIAREKLEKWISTLDIIKDWLRDIDLSDPQFLDFFDTGYFLPLPGRDKHGRKICLFREGSLDLSGRFTKNFTMKAIFGTYLAIMQDENTQVNGVSYFIDHTGFDMKHMMFFGLDDMLKVIKLWQGALPGRFKSFHNYNGGAVFETLMQAVMPILSKKFKDRFLLHGNNLENVYKHIPMELLPDEYLPDEYTGKSAGPIKDIIEQTKKDLTKPEVVKQIKYETGQDFSIDESKRMTYEQASYRQLNVE